MPKSKDTPPWRGCLTGMAPTCQHSPHSFRLLCLAITKPIQGQEHSMTSVPSPSDPAASLPPLTAKDRRRLLGPVLRDVSRAFYLTLRILPPAMREPVGLAYLLARAADTLADTSLLPQETRLPALRAFRELVTARQPPKPSPPSSPKPPMVTTCNPNAPCWPPSPKPSPCWNPSTPKTAD